MRKPLLIIGTFLGLVGFFIFYLNQQPQHTITDRSSQGEIADEDLIPPSERPTVIGPVNDGSVRYFDPHTGQLTWQFRADEYTPQQDGRVHVTKPEAVFYLKHDQMIRIRGANGLVTMPQQPKAGGNGVPFRASGSPPSRGDLKQVQIDFFDNQAAMDAEQSQLNIVLDNVAFDTETFRIFTEASVVDGKALTGEEIPVTVRGKDYDFDGRGLMIRWNERDRRLELLRIVHGDRLVVKDPRLIRGLSMQNEKASTKRGEKTSVQPAMSVNPPMVAQLNPQPVATEAKGNPLDAALATGNEAPRPIRPAPATAMAAVTPVSQPTTSAPSTRPLPQVYRANFDRDVRVTQDGTSLVNADQLLVDFTFETAVDAPKRRESSATSPATTPGATATSPVNLAPAREGPPTVAMVPVSGEPGSIDTPPAPSPIVIYWSGELRVTPQPDDAPRPSPGGALVHLVGSPLKLDRDGRNIECGRFSFDTGSEEVSMLAYGDKPLELTDPSGVVLHTASLKWQTRENIIQFPGGGQATLPLTILEQDQGATTQPADDAKILTALWSQNCRLEMAGDWQSGIVQISKAQLNGDVIIESPEMNLRGQSLSMEFEPDPNGKAKPGAVDAKGVKDIVAVPVMLSRAVATGNVYCEIINDNKKQIASGNYLEISTARNAQQQFYPRQLLIKGNAKLSGGGSEFSAAGSLDVHFAPDEAAIAAASTTQPADMLNSLVIQSLAARDNVILRTADGAFAMGDQLDITGSGLQREISLLGDPEAKVSDGKTTFSGPSLVAWPNQQKVSIVGPGSLQALRPGDKSSPITIEWRQGADIDGKSNSGQVRGGVTVTTREADGTVSGITSEKAELELSDAPSASAGEIKADQARNARLLGVQVMTAKVVSNVTFVDKTTVQSLLTDAQGNMLRRLTLFSGRVTYDVTGGKLHAPGTGRLLYEDHRPAEGQASDAVNGDKIDSSRLRGATAMEWKKQLTFDRATGQIVLDQDVWIVHDPDEQRPDAKESPDLHWELKAQRITATLEAKSGDAGTQPANGDGGVNDMARMTLQKIAADGQIWFTARNDVELTAAHIEFDPVSGLLRVTGNVEVRRGLSPGFFGEVIYNVREQRIVLMKDVRGRLRR